MKLKKTIHATLFCFLLICFSGIASGQLEIPKDFTPLFNGKDFTGWNIEPDMGVAWSAEDGRIICKGAPYNPYYILTEKEYENFELFVDFKMSKDCNSGIDLHQIERGWARESHLGIEIQVFDNAGKKITIGSCGSVYDALPPLSNPVKPFGHWNRYYIIMDWPILKIWLNGQLVQDANLENYDVTKYKLRRGFIGLQNHGNYVEYRNLYINELSSKEHLIQLFNEKNLNGWEKVGDAKWTIDNGEIIGTGGDGWLVSEQEFENYELRIFAGKYESGGTSGIYYNWMSQNDPGFKTEFRDWGPENKLKVKYRLTQIINYGNKSYVHNNGDLIQSNIFHNIVKKGRIAIFHSSKDGEIRIPKIQIKALDPV